MHDGMRRIFFTGLALLLGFLGNGEGVAAGIDWRLRMLMPTQESGSLTDNGTKSTSPPTTSGLGFHIVMSNGFGFGTTRVRSKGTISANSVSSTSDNVDLSYTFGERWSVTLGVGWGLTGKATLTESGTRYDTENLRGGSGFALFGIPFLGSMFNWPTRKEDEENALLMIDDPTSAHAEAFRQIRANIEFATAGSPGNVFMFTSTNPMMVSQLCCAMWPCHSPNRGKMYVLWMVT